MSALRPSVIVTLIQIVFFPTRRYGLSKQLDLTIVLFWKIADEMWE